MAILMAMLIELCKERRGNIAHGKQIRYTKRSKLS